MLRHQVKLLWPVLLLIMLMTVGEAIKITIIRNAAHTSLLRIATTGSQHSQELEKWVTMLRRAEAQGQQEGSCGTDNDVLLATFLKTDALSLSTSSSSMLSMLTRYHVAQLYYYAGLPSCAFSALLPLVKSQSESVLPGVKRIALWSAVQAGRSYLQAGDPLSAEKVLKTALEIQPDNLFALFYMYQTQTANGGSADPHVLYSLHRYHLDDSEPLFPYLGETVSGLMDSGVWSSSDSHKLLSMLVWQNLGNTATPDALALLKKIFPLQDDWKQLASEYVERSKVSAVSSEVAPTEFDLSTCPPSSTAVTNLGLAVGVGSNLVLNGNIEQVSGLRIMYWYFALGRTEPEDRHAWYVGGADRLISQSGNSLRIKNVWQDPDEKGSPFYAEYRSAPVLLTPNSTYVLSFVYRATSSKNQFASFLLADSLESGNPHVFAQGGLPATGAWQKVCFVFTTDHAARNSSLLIRNQELEDLWIDDVFIAELYHD